ncbi:hypothetical protein ABZS93_11660 [Streptomyces sp900116325]|uniref:hypothetical protein n=1 Tax=Streptomyces sp. 900116325 TaxID=3154295 RepID=UPI0033A1161E
MEGGEGRDPVVTAARRLHELGLIDGTPEELLRAVYDGDVLAAGFDVPDTPIPMLKRIAEHFDAHGVIALATDADTGDEDRHTTPRPTKGDAPWAARQPLSGSVHGSDFNRGATWNWRPCGSPRARV